VYAKEVDFRTIEDLVSDSQLDGNARYEGDELFGLLGADAHMPFFSPTGGLESPVVYPSAGYP
jgi:hypothetical protein